MAIEWTEDLEMGIPDIDRQHQELFQRINQLLEACFQGQAKETVGQTLQFLEDYVVEHFKNEEVYMMRYNYPGVASHTEQHRQFIQTFQELKTKFQTDGPGAHIVIMVNRAVVGWLNSHIRNTDQALGAYLKTKNVAG